MARTLSQPMDANTRAPSFVLPVANPEADAIEGETRMLSHYKSKELLVIVFMCNHCPYVVHVRQSLIDLANDYAALGVQLVGISANDAQQYPDDSFQKMKDVAAQWSFPFPYLYDESQDVARAYGAICTPDVFVFGPDRTLKYRGRLDGTRPGMGVSDARELRAALDEWLASGVITADQMPSIGCSIKWKPDNMPTV